MNPANNPRRRRPTVAALLNHDLHDHIGDRANEHAEDLDTLLRRTDEALVEITRMQADCAEMMARLDAMRERDENWKAQMSAQMGRRA